MVFTLTAENNGILYVPSICVDFICCFPQFGAGATFAGYH
jgi:hypothetical protein